MKNHLKEILILSVLSYLFFMFGNGIVSLTNPDEVFYAQTAKEMIQHHSWMTSYLFGQPQFEKPILLYWLLRIAFIIFGITSFAARFFPALFGILGVIGVYFLCLAGFKDKKKAFIAGLILMSSGLYVGLARTVFTDLIFSVFILFALAAFFRGYLCPKIKGAGLLLFFIFSALAVLTKGPLGIMVSFSTILIFLFLKKDLKFFKNKYTIWGIGCFLLISLPWYILMIQKYGRVFTDEFFYNDHIRRFLEAEHTTSDTWYFYPATMILGMFPWSIYCGAALFSLFKNLRQEMNPLRSFCLSWIIAVLFIFEPAHSKLASYIFPMFPALAVITADFIYDSAINVKNKRRLFYASLVTAFFFAVIVGAAMIASFISLNLILSYIKSGLPVVILITLLAVLFFSFLILTLRKKYLKSLYALMLIIAVIFCIVPIISLKIEPYISSRDACQYLLKNYKIDNTILCAKFFVRGVKFYTDKDVAVINIPGTQFFSPHPLLFLDSDLKVRKFLRKQPVTFCILNKTYLDDINRLSDEFNAEIIKAFGNEYIVRVTKRSVIDTRR